MGDPAVNRKLDLKVGDWVVVRPAEEILATLDENARFEECRSCRRCCSTAGRSFSVRKRAHKLCDTAFGTGGRQMTDAVFLDDIRCDGEAFGGCEMRCTIIWKEAWLEASRPNEPEVTSVPSERLETLVRAGTTARRLGRRASHSTCVRRRSCWRQQLLPWWKPGQYVED